MNTQKCQHYRALTMLNVSLTQSHFLGGFSIVSIKIRCCRRRAGYRNVVFSF